MFHNLSLQVYKNYPKLWFIKVHLSSAQTWIWTQIQDLDPKMTQERPLTTIVEIQNKSVNSNLFQAKFIKLLSFCWVEFWYQFCNFIISFWQETKNVIKVWSWGLVLDYVLIFVNHVIWELGSIFWAWRRWASRDSRSIKRRAKMGSRRVSKRENNS